MRKRNPWENLLRRSAMVNMQDGTAFDGVILRQDGQLLFMVNTTLYDPGAPDPVAITGEVVVQIEHVKFIQLQ